MKRTLLLILPVIMIIMVSCSQQESEEMGVGGSSGALTFDTPTTMAPTFTAVDQNGASFTTELLDGKPWIASFFFTSCETVCPALNTVVAELQAEFGTSLAFVSISTDPDTDTPAELRAYADTYQAVDGTWWMVRMPLDSMRSVASSGFALMDPREPAMHSTRLVAVNPDQSIAGYFDSTDSSDLRSLRTWINSQL